VLFACAFSRTVFLILPISWKKAQAGRSHPVRFFVLSRKDRKTGIFDEGAAQITQYDPATQHLFIVNGDLPGIDVVNISHASAPTKDFSVPIDSFGSGVQSIAIHGNLVALAVSADPKTDPGWIAFFDTDGNFLDKVQVGALPDMVTFTPDGSRLLCANEGEPSDDYSIDPEGSVSIIAFEVDEKLYFATANEGDARDYDA
jgi:DNA-binding beta-propeller fold protein YncE